MALEQAILGSGLDISANPKKILAQFLTRKAINLVVKNSGGASMFWGEAMQGIVREAFSLVSSAVYAQAELSSGKTREEIVEIAVDKAFSDASFVRAAQKAEGSADGGASPGLVRKAEAIVLELVQSNEINERGNIIQEITSSMSDVVEEVEDFGKTLQDLPNDIINLPYALEEAAVDSFNEYHAKVISYVEEIKDTLDVATHMHDAIDDTQDFLMRRIDIAATAERMLDVTYSSGAAVLATPLDLVDSITDFASDEFQSVIDQVYLRNASRGR